MVSVNGFSKYSNELPKTSVNQVFNRHIKKACEKAEINDIIYLTITKGGAEKTTKYEKWQKIASHTARRTFATTLYNDGISHIIIMGITSHSTLDSFLEYIKVTPERHAKMVQEFYKKDI